MHKSEGWAQFVHPSMYNMHKSMTQWLIGIFVRFLSFKDNLMRETKFPLSTTFNSLRDC